MKDQEWTVGCWREGSQLPAHQVRGVGQCCNQNRGLS